MTTDTKILKFLYPKKNDGEFYDVSKLMPEIPKDTVDNYVVTLEEHGYVLKPVRGYLPESAIPPGENMEDANNSRCRITPLGINYYDSFIKSRSNNFRSIIALIISIFAVLFSALSYFRE